MRVALITTRAVRGGAQVHLVDLMRGFREQTELLLIVGEEGYLTQVARQLGVEVRIVNRLAATIRPLQDLLALLAIRRTLAELRPDLVHVHSFKSSVLGRLAARSLGIPTVFTAHGWSFTEGAPRARRTIGKLIERWLAGYTDRIITVSRYDRELALAMHICPASKIVTIHNGVEAGSARRGQRPDRPMRIVMVARFEAPKDHSLLVRTLADCSFEFELLLVGDGPTREDVEKEIKQLGLEEVARCPGTSEDVGADLEEADLFVLTSNWEGFPLSVLEAMRAGLPVVASEVGGIGEAVAHGETGFLVPRGDRDKLAEALRRLAEDHELRRRMGEAGRRRFEEQFTVEPMLAATRGLYREVLARSPEAG